MGDTVADQTQSKAGTVQSRPFQTPSGEQPFGSDSVCGFVDAVFRAKPNHKVREVDAPAPPLEHALADSHIHLSMLRDPALSIARARAHGVDFICCISNPATDSDVVYSQINAWFSGSDALLAQMGAPAGEVRYRIACGCHPHDAKSYDDALEQKLLGQLGDPRTCCLGEIGLDYHYDFSPRDVQREVFRRQVRLAHKLGLPVALHLREAHDDALAIMDEEGFPQAGTILHCFNLGIEALAPWAERGCYIAVGGAATFGSAEDLRAALPHIPHERFLFETDGPFMAPVPFRSCECSSEHLVFTASAIASELGLETGEERQGFLARVHANTTGLLDREALPWQNAR